MRDGFSSTSVGKRWDLMKCSSGYHWQPFLSTANRVPFLHHLYVPTIFKCHQCLSKYLHILVITLLETQSKYPLRNKLPIFLAEYSFSSLICISGLSQLHYYFTYYITLLHHLAELISLSWKAEAI